MQLKAFVAESRCIQGLWQNLRSLQCLVVVVLRGGVGLPVIQQ